MNLRHLCFAVTATTSIALAATENESADLAAAKAYATQLANDKLPAEERRAIQDKMLQLGTPGAALLQGILTERTEAARADFHRRTKDYFRNFGRVATKVVARGQKGKQSEIGALQDTLRALRQRPDLTKEEIIHTGDPALERLGELFSADPAEVILADEALAREREALVAIGLAVEDDQAFLEVCEWQLESEIITSGIFDEDTNEDSDNAAEAPPFDALAELDRGESWELALATPMSKSHRNVLLANYKLADQIDPEELLGVRVLNLMRIRLGLTPLPIDVRLCDACRDHSLDMDTLGFFSHTSPVPGKTTPGQRAARFKTSGNAENIAAGQDTGAGAIRAWWHSPGHHKNMLGGHGRIGLGRYRSHWTQLFG